MIVPLPIHVAATGLEMLVWLGVGAIWLIFQGLAHAAKQKPTPPGQRPTLPKPEDEPDNELRDLFQTVTGQKSIFREPEADEDEAPTLPRAMTAPPRPFAQSGRQTIRPVAKPVPVTRRAAPPPVPGAASLSQPAAEAHPVFVPTTTTREALRLAPLMKMKWPRSPLGNLSITAAARTGHPTLLRRRLHGHIALRHAMVSRIVLGRPVGD